jgi:hypothetical protein
MISKRMMQAINDVSRCEDEHVYVEGEAKVREANLVHVRVQQWSVFDDFTARISAVSWWLREFPIGEVAPEDRGHK